MLDKDTQTVEETQTQSREESQYFNDEDLRQFEEPFYLNNQFNYIRGGSYRKFVIKAAGSQSQADAINKAVEIATE